MMLLDTFFMKNPRNFMKNPRNFLKNPYNEVFYEHEDIAIDVDETLIGNNPYKNKLRKAIKRFVDNSLDSKRIHIITFRCEPVDKTINDIMSEWEDFPHELVETWNHCPPRLFLYFVQEELKVELSRELLSELSMWKAEVCSRLGCTVLIDDNIELTLPGAIEHEIRLFHPHLMKYVW